MLRSPVLLIRDQHNAYTRLSSFPPQIFPPLCPLTDKKWPSSLLGDITGRLKRLRFYWLLTKGGDPSKYFYFNILEKKAVKESITQTRRS